MTREQVKDLLPFLQAFANGEPIQIFCGNDNWLNMEDNNLNIDPDLYRYRVKPMPKYRPFNSCKECWEEMQKHVPFGWIVSKNGLEYYHIDYILNTTDNSPIMLRISGSSFLFSEIFEEFTFPDGTPFGIKE